MSEAAQPDSTRVQTACRFCRYSKLKCSGTKPCDRCLKRRKECIYDTKDAPPNRIDKAASNKRQRLSLGSDALPVSNASSLPHSSEVARPTLPHLPSESNVQSGTANEKSSPQFLRNRPGKGKRWLYLGASSTWSFNIRVATLMRSHLNDDATDKFEGFTLDGEVHTFALRQSSSDTALDFTRLPSLDYAIYLINTVKFHLGGMLQIFDEASFSETLHEFYSDGSRTALMNKLWYTHFLLLLALGKGFLNVRHSPDNTSSFDLFLRAMSTLPDTITMHDDPVPAAEVLVTIALYFYCLDMRNCAYSYVGQAMRLALVEGMHADLPVDQIGTEFSARCRRIWWTVYILDRTLSSAVGAPVSVQDDHIRQPLSSARESSQKEATLIMHVKLCRVVSFILNELYTTNENLGQSYLSKTRSVLLQMADIAKELEDTIEFKFKSSFETLSKGALYLRMLYNQCIILATRPLFICLLQDLLSSLSSETSRRAEIPSSLHDLLETCVVSATKTLKMLDSLHDHNLLDTFLPFDLEFACSASSALIMVDEILRGHKVSFSTKSLISKVLGKIAQGGNKAAPLREAELQHIQHLARRVWESVESNQVGPLTSLNRLGHAASAENLHSITDTNFDVPIDRQNITSTSDLVGDGDGSLVLVGPSTTSSMDFAQTFDFSQDQMLFVANHLADEAFPSLLDFDNHGLDEWI